MAAVGARSRTPTPENVYGAEIFAGSMQPFLDLLQTTMTSDKTQCRDREVESTCSSNSGSYPRQTSTPRSSSVQSGAATPPAPAPIVVRLDEHIDDKEDAACPPPPAPIDKPARKRRGHRGGVGRREATMSSIANNAELKGEEVALGFVQRSVQSNPAVERMLRDFKTQPCGLEVEGAVPHDHRSCPFFHNENDRRRVVMSEDGQPLYCAEPCPDHFDDNRICMDGDECAYCHSTAELHYHPDLFRTRLCHQGRRCPRGRYCAFAHTRRELLVPHFREVEENEPTEEFIEQKFKTLWCPLGGSHDWNNCVYAHTYRDWRRVPLLGYSSRPCPHWNQTKTKGVDELTYIERCPRGIACPMAHGAKEQLYHPQFYKTTPCGENCKRGAMCAFMHGPDAREPLPDERRHQHRNPIPDAAMLLEKHQPNYKNPPRYLGPDEPIAGTAISSRRSRRGGSARATISGVVNDSSTPELQTASGVIESVEDDQIVSAGSHGASQEQPRFGAHRELPHVRGRLQGHAEVAAENVGAAKIRARSC